MKKVKLLLALLLALTLANNCNHTHNEECGYDSTTQTGCTHEHDEECGLIEPLYEYDPDNPRG